jgi:phosphoribosylanthranilate isomerase
VVEIKFCGMTRPHDAREAAAAGARYVGVVFAGGPRRQDDASASAIFAAVPPEVGRAGVFGVGDARVLASRAAALGLSVIQLHGDPTAADVRALRECWTGEIWAVLRVTGTELPSRGGELFAAADAVLLDAKADGALGGTGVPLAWDALAGPVTAARSAGRARLVLAGGLRAENVARAVTAIRPDVVDVSSGIESQVGIKNAGRMRAFREAVASVEESR